MPRLVGFAWEGGGGTLEVCWGTPNGNLAEASRVGTAWAWPGEPWQLTALNAVTNAPLASQAGITAYAWESGGSKQVSYLTEGDRHIHELSVVGGGNWQHADLTQLTGAPACSYGVMSGYPWKENGTKQIAYITADGHIHELWVHTGGSWQHADLTQKTGAPLNEGGQISGYAWEKGGTKQVVYKGANMHIHELYVAMGGSWQHADLTQLTGAPVASGTFLGGFAWEQANTKQVIYVTWDGHIHELSVAPNQSWKHTDLTSQTGAPTAVPSEQLAAYAWPRGELAAFFYTPPGRGIKQVAFLRDGDRHVHELSIGIGESFWQHADLTQLTGAPIPSVTSYFSGYSYSWDLGGSKHVVYTTDDGHVHELRKKLIVGGGARPHSAHWITEPWEHAVLPGLTH